MGKETKIGLAVIGVLLLVFSVLLFRHLSVGESVGQWDNETRAAAQPLTPQSATDKPNVVTARNDRPGGGTGDSLWDISPGQASSRSDVEVPAPSYMPAERSRSDAPTDRYSIGRQNVEADERSVSASPFQDHRLDDNDAAGAAEPAADELLNDSTQVPQDEASTSEPSRNPLRRLSADLPLHGPDAAPIAEANTTLSDQDHHRDAVDEETARSADAPDAYPSPRGAASTPDEFDSGPTALARPQGEYRDPAESDDLRESVPDDYRQDPPRNDDRREPALNDWTTSDVADEPTPVGNLPLPVEDGRYTVQPNDTLWSISEKVYGTGGYFKALAAHNQASLPRSDQLSVGMEVAVPPVGDLERDYPSLCPRQRKSALVKPRAMPAAATVPDTVGRGVYVVQEGDTLFDIARYELGKASRWAEIYELNRAKLGEDFDYLRPGTELRLPAKTRAAETISRGGDSRYLR